MFIEKAQRGATLVHKKYTRERLRGAREERKSEKVITIRASQAAAQVKRVLKKKCKRSSKLLLESSKNLPFLSGHRHHMIQSGTIFQTKAL
jgi:hypothetical protein